MEQIECFGQGIAQFLVLSGIFAQIDLRLTVARIAVILAAGLKIGVGFVVVFVQYGHTQFVSQLPAGLVVGILRMRSGSGRTDDDNLRMSLLNLLVHVAEPFGKLGRNLLLVTYTQIL